MILLIDTADFNNLQLAIVDPKKGSLLEQHFSVAYNENYKTAAFLEQFLKKNKLELASLKKIVVCSGPGSFTGIRVGVSLAQALGLGLQVPVIATPKNKLPKNLLNLDKIKQTKKLTLFYGTKANITKPKK